MLAKLRAATFEVLETMFFLFPEGLEEDESLRTQGPFICTWVSISGPQPLRLGMIAPQSLARKMAANFLGTQEDAVFKPEMEDVLREVTNMTAGSFLSKLEASSAFHLQTPHARWLTPEEEKQKRPANRLRFDVDGELLELFVERDS